MIFSSVTFLIIFLPIVLGLYYLAFQNIQHRNVLLLISSLIFYFIGEPIWIIIMILSICINYRFGILIDKADEKKDFITKKYILRISILINLSILFLFKYEGFIVENTNKFFKLNLDGLGLLLPIGISFYTFQAISYVVDVYRKQVSVQKNLMKLGLYISFFPQLIAGPIVRYSTINDQIDNRITTSEKFASAIRLFLFGVGKKIIFANNFGVVSEYAFGLEPNELSVTVAWLGSICYSLQIFFDFSGYSDMAIGLARMFGFEFEKNFDYPYISKTVSEFWRRWHISLGSWFRDYVYIPLGGSKVGSFRLVFNLFVVWFLTGVWHGASWQFLIWGLIYFFALTFEKLSGVPENLKNNFLKYIYQFATLLLVNFCWVIFGESDLEQAFYYIISMFGAYDNEFTDPMFLFHFGEIKVLLLFGILASTPFFRFLNNKIQSKLNNVQAEVYECLKSCFAMVVLVISISYLSMGST